MSVFYGWMPDADAQDALGSLVDSLRDALPAGTPTHSWRHRQQWHVTLRFLGDDASPEQRQALTAALIRAVLPLDPFDAVIAALQYWPGARVLVATLESSPAIEVLLHSCEVAARACGLPPERRTPRPHLTLAYLRERVPATRLPALPAPPTIPLRIASARLLRSIPLGYRSWYEAPLGGGA